MHEIQVLICWVVVEEKGHGEDAGNCRFPLAAKLIPFAVRNVVDFGDVGPSYVVVVEENAILVVCLLQYPRHRRRRRHLSCP